MRETTARRLFRLLLCGTLLFAAASALAEEPLPAPEMALFGEIPSVFGASKYEQKVTEAPATVTIVTAAEIKKYGYRNLPDLLRSVRGFTITSDRNYDYIGVRGFGRPGDYNTRVLILVDGHRTSDNIYDSALSGNAFFLDIDLIDRVEIIRGPSSSLYGTGAFFAVINIITKRGRDYQGPEASAEAGSHDTYDGRLSYGRRFHGGPELLLSGTAGKSSGRDWFYPEFADPATNDGNAEGRDRERFRQGFLKAALTDFTLTGGYGERKKGVPTAPWDVVFNADTWTLDRTWYLDLKYERPVAERWSVLARLFYDYYWYEGEYPYDVAADGDPPEIVVGLDEAEGSWWGTELQFTGELGEAHRLVVGAEYRDNRHQDQRYFDDRDDPASLVLDSEENSDYWAIYAQDELRLSERLLFNLGLRHDHYSTFGGTTNPRLALIWTLRESTVLKFLYGEAFRGPNAYERFYHDGRLTTKPNPDLEPETIKTYEAVWEQQLGEHLRTVAAAFYYEIEDLINQTEDPTDLSEETGEPLLIFENLDTVEAWGAELELEGKRESGLAGRVSYSFQQVEERESGRTLSNSPRHLAKLNLIVPLIRRKVFLGLEEQYTSRRKTNAGGETGGYAITNVTLSGQGLLPGLEASASVYNLFDKKFSDPGAREHRQESIEQEGRLFRFKLTCAF